MGVKLDFYYKKIVFFPTQSQALMTNRSFCLKNSII